MHEGHYCRDQVVATGRYLHTEYYFDFLHVSYNRTRQLVLRVCSNNACTMLQARFIALNAANPA